MFNTGHGLEFIYEHMCGYNLKTVVICDQCACSLVLTSRKAALKHTSWSLPHRGHTKTSPARFPHGVAKSRKGTGNRLVNKSAIDNKVG